MNISSQKQMKSHARGLAHGNGKEIVSENPNLF